MLTLRRFSLLFAGLFVAAPARPQLAAQTVIAIPPQQCVWRAGDNLAWAAPDLDETGWQPYTRWNRDLSEPRYWVRCKTDLSAEAYDELAFTLTPGHSLIFLSDGIVEARNKSGELFGFERTRALSGQPAESIARAAQHFGQQDDITVLTLLWQPAANASAPDLAASALGTALRTAE